MCADGPQGALSDLRRLSGLFLVCTSAPSSVSITHRSCNLPKLRCLRGSHVYFSSTVSLKTKRTHPWHPIMN